VHLHEEEKPQPVVERRPREESLLQSAERQLPVVDVLLDASHLQSAERLHVAERLLDASHLQSAERLHVAERLLDAESLLQSAERLPAEEEPHDADLFAEHLQSAEESPDARLHLDAELLEEEDSQASRTSWAKS
jgi:hypothetical protein